jgi:hypothetical protein
VSHWLLKYHEKYRDFVAKYGVDDRGNETLMNFNMMLIEAHDFCQDKGHGLLMTVIETVYDYYDGDLAPYDGFWNQYGFDDLWFWDEDVYAEKMRG